MRAVEFLRKLADALAVIDNDSGDETAAQPEVMVPPLQQKIEILKKSQGIDNIYDTDGETDPAGSVTVTTAEEDEPFEG